MTNVFHLVDGLDSHPKTISESVQAYRLDGGSLKSSVVVFNSLVLRSALFSSNLGIDRVFKGETLVLDVIKVTLMLVSSLPVRRYITPP